MDNYVNRNIRRLRESNNLTQQQVSDYLGIGRSAYANYESGERGLPLDIAEKIADLFGCDLNLLYENDANVVDEMLTCSFRIDNINKEDLQQIARFKSIVRDYLKMNRLLKSHEIG
ncbi:MAG: helix-turn-helix transcriptional regulator [Bacteroidales bacterium]|nr:helix-turn-helix transcriptional regulator [Bacteroidales bacterium]MDY6002444.1 helix-turn-helix transcriptional regulator [Candidatus Cryptobacteroides sp.]